MQLARGDGTEPEGPERARDDTDEGWGEPEPRDDRGDDRRLVEERPPHHDRW